MAKKTAKSSRYGVVSNPRRESPYRGEVVEGPIVNKVRGPGAKYIDQYKYGVRYGGKLKWVYVSVFRVDNRYIPKDRRGSVNLSINSKPSVIIRENHATKGRSALEDALDHRFPHERAILRRIYVLANGEVRAFYRRPFGMKVSMGVWWLISIAMGTSLGSTWGFLISKLHVNTTGSSVIGLFLGAVPPALLKMMVKGYINGGPVGKSLISTKQNVPSIRRGGRSEIVRRKAGVGPKRRLK